MTAAELDKVFLADILANPDDDAPRLVFADFIEDRNPERAQYIRQSVWHSACQLDELVKKDGKAWKRLGLPYTRWSWSADGEDGAGLHDDEAGIKYFVDRGFIHKARSSITSWAVKGKTICASHPVKQLVIIDTPVAVNLTYDEYRPTDMYWYGWDQRDWPAEAFARMYDHPKLFFRGPARYTSPLPPHEEQDLLIVAFESVEVAREAAGAALLWWGHDQG